MRKVVLYTGVEASSELESTYQSFGTLASRRHVLAFRESAGFVA